MKNELFVLTTEHSFDAAHFLKGHNGACANVHGHRWRAVLEISGEELQKEGSSREMIIDFTDIKKEFRKLIDEFDHSFIVESYDHSVKKHTIKYDEVIIHDKEKGGIMTTSTRIVYIPFRPTAEKFSKYIYEVMKEMNYPVHAVTVYETPTNSCRYCLRG